MPACRTCSATIPQSARFCPQCGQPAAAATVQDSEFRAWRLNVTKRQLIFCLIAIPVGLLFIRMSPPTTLVVSGLACVGVIIAARRLARLRANGDAQGSR